MDGPRWLRLGKPRSGCTQIRGCHGLTLARVSPNFVCSLTFISSLLVVGIFGVVALRKKKERKKKRRCGITCKVMMRTCNLSTHYQHDARIEVDGLPKSNVAIIWTPTFERGMWLGVGLRTATKERRMFKKGFD
jgi:hypothetical protein